MDEFIAKYTDWTSQLVIPTKWMIVLSPQSGGAHKADEFVHQRIWLILQDDSYNIKDNEMNKSTEETSWNYSNEKDLNSMNLSV